MPFVKKRILKKHTGSVSRARWTDDGKYLMTCGFDKSLRLWNPFKSEATSDSEALHIKEYSGVHGHEVVDVAITKDNSTFVSCGGDKACFLWDVTGGHILRRFEGHAHRINAVTFNKEDTILVSGSYDQSIRLWDMRSRNREPIQIISDFKDSVSSIDISEYEILAGCVDGSVRTYDLRTGQCHCDMIGKPITSICLSHDNRCILTSILGGSIALIDKMNGQIISSYFGHINQEYSLQSCLNYNDEFIISGLMNNNVIDTLDEHKKAVIGVTSHPKEQLFVSSSLDGTSIFWEFIDP